jgi:hypothetical protein
MQINRLRECWLFFSCRKQQILQKTANRRRAGRPMDDAAGERTEPTIRCTFPVQTAGIPCSPSPYSLLPPPGIAA